MALWKVARRLDSAAAGRGGRRSRWRVGSVSLERV